MVMIRSEKGAQRSEKSGGVEGPERECGPLRRQLHTTSQQLGAGGLCGHGIKHWKMGEKGGAMLHFHALTCCLVPFHRSASVMQTSTVTWGTVLVEL